MANSLVVNNTAIDLGNYTTPFLPGRNCTAVNQTAGALTLQKGDAAAGPWTTLAVVPADGTIAIPTLPPFIRVSTAANVTLIGVT